MVVVAVIINLHAILLAVFILSFTVILDQM